MSLILILIGLLIRIIAGKKLIKFSWRIIPPQELTTNGLYSKIRHPMYLGTFIFTIGLFWLLVGFKIAICLNYIVMQFIFDRIDREEQLLIMIFGDKYIEYIKKTKMLIPFIL